MLPQATLAGQGPDVAVQVGSDLPMNYGMRSAVVDLSNMTSLRKFEINSETVPWCPMNLTDIPMRFPKPKPA